MLRWFPSFGRPYMHAVSAPWLARLLGRAAGAVTAAARDDRGGLDSRDASPLLDEPGALYEPTPVGLPEAVPEKRWPHCGARALLS